MAVDLEQVKARVKAGAEWMDANVAGWAERIDRSRFDITCPCHCILGQTYGDFFRAPLPVNDETSRIPEELGFIGEFWGEGSEAEDEALADAWIGEIERRLESTDTARVTTK